MGAQAGETAILEMPVLRAAVGALSLVIATAARAEIEIIRVDSVNGTGVALLRNGPTVKDVDRWRTGQLNGWGSCGLIKADTEGEICGCLGRQLSDIGPFGVTLALDNVKACAALFVVGEWDSSWSQDVQDQAPVTFHYDPKSKTITGCWAERSGEGKITGFIKGGEFSMARKTLTFNYEDRHRKASGEATLTLSNTPQALTLLGNWSQKGGAGAWTMTRDPVHPPAACAGP